MAKRIHNNWMRAVIEDSEFEKWRAIRASVGGVGDVLAWVTWVVCLRGWRASMGGVGGMLAWVAWVAWVACLRG